MFKKLSPALVAISLVAVAQPALAQDATHNMIVGSTTENSVTGQAGPIWTYAPGNRKVTVEGQRTLRKNVKKGMYCSITGTRTGDWSTGIKNGTINEIACESRAEAKEVRDLRRAQALEDWLFWVSVPKTDKGCTTAGPGCQD